MARLMDRILYRIADGLPCRLISDDGTPYLERYYLGTLLGWRFYLHRFVGSDPARGLHDHPWRRAVSLILSGSYWEERRQDVRLVRWFNRLTGDTFHRVVLRRQVSVDLDGELHERDLPVWTLFAHTVGDVKVWGFWRDAFEVASGAATFLPYTYPEQGGKKDPRWWLSAPRGRSCVGRAAA